MEDFVECRIGNLTIRIDRTLCISSANCMKVVPEIFEFDDEKICAFKDNAADVDVEQERLIDGCAVCPVDALIVIDADGKQLVP